MTNLIPKIKLWFELIDRETIDSIRFEEIATQYDYHYAVAAYGGRDDLDLYLRLQNEVNGKFLDQFIMHAPDIRAVDGYGVPAHEYRATRMRRERTNNPLKDINIFFDMKLSGDSVTERVKLDGADTYYDLYMKYQDNESKWDKFVMLIVDQAESERVIDKINICW